MRYNDLIEDATNDMGARDQIRSVIRRLIKVMPSFSEFHIGELSSPKGSLKIPYLTMKEMGFSDFTDLAIGTIDVSDDIGVFMKIPDDRNVNIPAVNMLLITAKPDATPSQVAQSIRKLPYTVIHELVHYQDLKRKKGKTVSATSNTDMSASDYFNHSFELNAYYHEGIARMEDNQNFMAMTDMEFTDFIKFSFRFFERDWLQHLSDDNRKRLIKRLFSLWQSYQNTNPA